MKELALKTKVLFVPCRENNFRPRFLMSDFLLYWILVLLVFKLFLVYFIFCFPKTVFFADITKTALVSLTNEERQSLNLPILTENPKLSQAALQKAQDMLNYDYFSHYSPTGVTPWYWFKKEGYSYQSAGENLAIGFLDSEEVVRAWNNSPSHRANLLNPNFQETGIAVAKGEFQGSETTVVVQLFGKPLAKAGPETKETTEEKITSPPPVSGKTEPAEKEILPEEPKEMTAGVKEGGGEILSSQPESEEEAPGFASNFLKFITLNYSELLQKILFFSLFLITFALILNIFVEVRIQDRKLIFKTIILVILLILFIVSDKELIIQLIPHSLII